HGAVVDNDPGGCHADLARRSVWPMFASGIKRVHNTSNPRAASQARDVVRPGWLQYIGAPRSSSSMPVVAIAPMVAKKRPPGRSHGRMPAYTGRCPAWGTC